MKSRESLVEALTELGWTKEQIEVHDQPQHLYGYRGDRREQTAEVIIRRQYVPGMSNDIGFQRQEDGTFTAIISEYDRHRHNDEWVGKLQREYAVSVTQKQFAKQGMPTRIQRKQDGSVRLVATVSR